MIGQDDDGINGEGLFDFDGMKSMAEMVDGSGILEDGLPLVGNNGKKVGGSWGGCTAVVHLGNGALMVENVRLCQGLGVLGSASLHPTYLLSSFLVFKRS
ncbi:hypothetical protein [Nodosilinea sp. P-1105]|uniref:hypothetical protein n=1 Tax=Nodosilinea sp. P-1105 TaxID=2546229 RepID=UPI00146F4A94|nr:hypothetical protein [Nodosilinea sp. P-1105]